MQPGSGLPRRFYHYYFNPLGGLSALT